MYKDLIKKAVPEASEDDLPELEDIMRHDIFHSTLDWIPKGTFYEGARTAWELLGILREADAQIS